MNVDLECPYCNSKEIVIDEPESSGMDSNIDYAFYEILKCTCYDCLREFRAKRYYTVTKIDYEEKDE